MDCVADEMIPLRGHVVVYDVTTPETVVVTMDSTCCWLLVLSDTLVWYVDSIDEEVVDTP